MLSLFTLWASAGIITALMIPHTQTQIPIQNKPQPAPALANHSITPQALGNYTAIYLHNTTINARPPCAGSLISHSSFPNTLDINATQCAVDCEYISAQRANMGDPLRCRAFNVYLVWLGQRNLGMQCRMFDRRVDGEIGMKGDESGEGLLGLEDATWFDGKRLMVSDSFAYWLMEENKDESRGEAVSSKSSESVLVTQNVVNKRLMKLRNNPVVASPTIVSTPVVVPALTSTMANAYLLDPTMSVLRRGATRTKTALRSTSVLHQASTFRTSTTKAGSTGIKHLSTVTSDSSLTRHTAGLD